MVTPRPGRSGTSDAGQADATRPLHAYTQPALIPTQRAVAVYAPIYYHHTQSDSGKLRRHSQHALGLRGCHHGGSQGRGCGCAGQKWHRPGGPRDRWAAACETSPHAFTLPHTTPARANTILGWPHTVHTHFRRYPPAFQLSLTHKSKRVVCFPRPQTGSGFIRETGADGLPEPYSQLRSFSQAGPELQPLGSLD